jgi:hypothetical protein
VKKQEIWVMNGIPPTIAGEHQRQINVSDNVTVILHGVALNEDCEILAQYIYGMRLTTYKEVCDALKFF